MNQKIGKTIWQAFCLTAIILTSCDKTAHEIPEDLPQDGSAITIGLNTKAIQGTPLKDAHLYFFNSSETLVEHTYYANMQELALDRMLMETGYYTVFAVLNTKESCLPTIIANRGTKTSATVPTISFSEFCQWVKSIDNGTYPSMATGLVRREVKEGLSEIIIDIKKGSQAVEFSNVKLNLTFPSPGLPDFISIKSAKSNSRAAGNQLQLRTMIDVYNKGTEENVLHKTVFVTPTTTEGVYTTDLQLSPGKYDIRLWADYTTDEKVDNHYVTSDPTIVYILPKNQYLGNTDTKDAFTQAVSISVGTTDQEEGISMHRPLAKYRLIATDVEKYEQMRVTRGFPALQDLKISIAYEGFLPNAYSVKIQKPADADTGYGYTSALSEQSDNAVMVGKDYVLVNGTESFVKVTILFKDPNGKVISGIKGVKVDYRAGMLTTVKGNFLTAGVGGVQIDTEWSGDYNVNF